MGDRRQLLLVEVPLGALGAALVSLAFVFAAAGIPSWIPPAPLVRLGVASPLTGMTRSFVALAEGRLLEAFSWHPLGPVCFAIASAAAVVALASCVRGQRFEGLARLLRRRGVWLAVALVIAAGWIRQILYFG